MTSLESIERLREWSRLGPMVCKDLLDIADEIEREIAEKYMKLPIDRDGVAIHTGDKMEACCAEVADRFTAYFFAENGDALDDETCFFDPANSRHVIQRTVEDVLRDCCNEWNEHCGDDWESGVYAKYADELRELIKEGEL